MGQIELTAIHKRESTDISFLNQDTVRRVNDFHRSFPMYKETPLADLKELAGYLGIAGLYVKDESYRFGLNAFKVLGGSYAMGSYLAGKRGLDISDLPYEKMISEENRAAVGNITFITATDGNHGRGVAWTANQLKQSCIVYMPKGSSQERLENIRAQGARASITELNYDDAVRLANKEAEENGYVMVQDTAWEGYEDIPRWIIQGYGTMAYEADQQLGRKPTHIFIQAGVGSVATAVTGYFANRYQGDEKPCIVIVEPGEAACIFRTAQAGDGKIHPVTGDMDTIMAGLACGEPCTLGWKVLENYADYAVKCPDEIAAKGMRVLGNPLDGDPKVVSGESGAVTTGLVAELLQNPKYQKIKETIGLNEQSVVLCFSTEGDTDKKSYRDIVWDGKDSSFHK